MPPTSLSARSTLPPTISRCPRRSSWGRRDAHLVSDLRFLPFDVAAGASARVGANTPQD
jgi:hypothetical protein